MKAVAGAATGRRLYLDTSAYLCILLGEEGSQDLSNETDGAELLSSVILILRGQTESDPAGERRRAETEHVQDLPRASRAGYQSVGVTGLDSGLVPIPPLPAVATPRSLDLAHLRSALWFHADERIDRFVTLDGSQELAARELGLPV